MLSVRLQQHAVGQGIMKLILLYGPPAVGKLTIAKELARLTGFKLFHAHLTSDVVEAIFPRGTPRFAHWRGTSAMRCLLQPRKRTSMA